MKSLVDSASECFRKNRYPTEESADKIAKLAEKERGAKLRVYYCKICLGFHLTSKPLLRKATYLS
jgi:hypothetical protein